METRRSSKQIRKASKTKQIIKTTTKQETKPYSYLQPIIHIEQLTVVCCGCYVRVARNYVVIMLLLRQRWLLQLWRLMLCCVRCEFRRMGVHLNRRRRY